MYSWGFKEHQHSLFILIQKCMSKGVVIYASMFIQHTKFRFKITTITTYYTVKGKFIFSKKIYYS